MIKAPLILWNYFFSTYNKEKTAIQGPWQKLPRSHWHFYIRYISDNTLIVLLSSLRGCAAVAATWQVENIFCGGCQEVHSGVRLRSQRWLLGVLCVCVWVCRTKKEKKKVSLQILEDDGGGTRLLLRVPGRHNQVGPGGLGLPRPSNTQPLLNGTEVIEGLEWGWWHGVWQRIIIWVWYKYLSCKPVMRLGVSAKDSSPLNPPDCRHCERGVSLVQHMEGLPNPPAKKGGE